MSAENPITIESAIPDLELQKAGARVAGFLLCRHSTPNEGNNIPDLLEYIAGEPELRNAYLEGAVTGILDKQDGR